MKKEQVDITTLDNGLRIISQKMNETEAVTIEIWTGVGSRYERPEQNGISHFLEHMAFKGTNTRTAKQIAEDFDNIGGQLNAFTSREHTVYYAKVLKENFNEAADLLADIIQNSIFEQKEIERERNVVLQEIAMTNDSPDDIIFDLYQATAFSNQPLGRSILGPSKLVANFSRDDLTGYVSEHYHGANLVLSVAGNVEHKTVVEFAKKHLSNIPKGKRSQKETANYSGGEHREERDLEQVHLTFGFKGISYLDEDVYKVQLLSCILGGGMSSRLFQEIRENRGLAYSVSSFNSSYLDSGTFTVYSATSPEKINELINAVCDEMKKATSDITEAELKKAKAQAKAGLLMAQESSNNRADALGRRLICYNRYISNQEILDRMNSTTVTDVKEVLEKIITSSKPTIAAIGKLDKLESYNDINGRLAA
ncbi:MAG: pitrilysin family protein [Rickettsiales bacterium]|nr:pitrilysin family protein [Pseudomonadota bacterium]MDA0965351.1 pitrilysin family protein [Pseudomonadota bacterium]MDG4544279.1 pitrilysin family protein [Rickettsiales bacterium]MDG4544875.1 pitrilysin family protein [Rickettsiales bacterium]MDG4546998.1 pitrilysin family protein [Rickettsiales bacterium]